MKKNIKNYRRLTRAFRHFLGKTLYREDMDEEQVIFIHIPKAAGTSVCQAVFGTPESNHYTARCYRSDHPQKFVRYYKFTVVRNPYDRFCSAFHYLKNGGDRLSERDKQFRDQYLEKYVDINDFALNGLNSDEIYRRPHFEAQYEYLFDDDEKTLLVDYVGRMEDLEQFSQQLSNELGTNINIGHQNKTCSAATDLCANLTDKAKTRIYEKYKKDFDLLGYEK